MGTGNFAKQAEADKGLAEYKSNKQLHEAFRVENLRTLTTLQLVEEMARETVHETDEAEARSLRAAEEGAFREAHIHTLQPQNRRMLTQAMGAFRSLHPDWVSIHDQWVAAREALAAEQAEARAAAAAAKVAKVPAAVAAEAAVAKLAAAEDSRVEDLQGQVAALTMLVTKLASELGVSV